MYTKYILVKHKIHFRYKIYKFDVKNILVDDINDGVDDIYNEFLIKNTLLLHDV